MRALCVAALFLTACSFDAEKANITITVSGIPAAADHLDVTLSAPSDSSVQPKQFRPSFQPGALATGTIVLEFAAPSATGTFKVDVVAGDRACPSPCAAPGLAQGTLTDNEPAAGSVVNDQITLH